MGNVHLRVDGRMIHGQVANAWSRLLKTDEILVIDDEVAVDETQVMLLEFAVPPGIDFTMCTVDSGYDLLFNNKTDSKNVFVIFKKLSSAVELYNKGYEFEELNIGGMYYENNKKQYDKALFLDEKDIEDIKYLLDKGVEVYYQTAPMNKKVSITKFI